MFGAFFYGFVDREDVKGDLRIASLANRMDINDFMHSNSPYSSTFVRPISRGPVVVHSDSPPSPPMNLESPNDAAFVVMRQPESVGEHVSTDPGIQGIDQFGTNTFRICSLLNSEQSRVPPAQGTQGAGTSQSPIDMETDTEWDMQMQQRTHEEDSYRGDASEDPQDEDMQEQGHQEQSEGVDAQNDEGQPEEAHHEEPMLEEQCQDEEVQHGMDDVVEDHHMIDRRPDDRHWEGQEVEKVLKIGLRCLMAQQSEGLEAEVQHGGSEPLEVQEGEDRRPDDQTGEGQGRDSEVDEDELMIIEQRDQVMEDEQAGAEELDRDDVQITQEVNERTPKPSEVVLLSDEDEFDHPHSSDEDDEEPTDPFAAEFKVLTTASGSRVKVEKDYWRKEEEKRAKRIKRHQEKLEKDRLLAESQEQNRLANERIAQMQAESDIKMSILQAQMKMLYNQAGLSLPSEAAVLSELQPPPSSSSSPPVSILERPLVVTPDRRPDNTGDAVSLPGPDHSAAPTAETSYRRLDDKVDEVSLVDPDRLASPPSHQPILPSPLSESAGIRLPEDVAEASPPIHDRRPDDNVEKETVASQSRSEDAAASDDRRPDDPVEEEEKVDYELGAEDLDLCGSRQPSSSEVPSPGREPEDQVQTSDPYCFD